MEHHTLAHTPVWRVSTMRGHREPRASSAPGPEENHHVVPPWPWGASVAGSSHSSSHTMLVKKGMPHDLLQRLEVNL